MDGADARQVGRKRKRRDDGGEIDEVDGKNCKKVKSQE